MIYKIVEEKVEIKDGLVYINDRELNFHDYIFEGAITNIIIELINERGIK